MVDNSILADNAAELEGLERLIARLSDANLARDLGGGWTVAVALAHMAFWDRRAIAVLSHWADEGRTFQDHDDDVYNEALLDEWLLLPPRRAVELALGAAQLVNKTVEILPDRVSVLVVGLGFEWLLRRAKHRSEHIEQIERALG